MAANDTITNTNLSTTNQHMSVFLCPERLNPNADLNSITFSWILVAIIFITCPFTVLFNSLVIVALKKRRELEKRSNILLCSMAVTDLLTGAITMPLSATYELLILSQVPFQDICPIHFLVNKLMIFSLSTSSLYHLTAIAWERKMAVKSWIKYRNNVTESRLTGLAIAAWLFGVITPGPPILMVVAGVHRKFISIWLVGKIVSMIGCLAAIGYFYFMIFLEVRKRDRNQINQVAFLGRRRSKLLTHKQCKRDVKESNSFFFRFLYSVFCSRYFFISLIVLKWCCELCFFSFFSFESPRKLREA